MTQPGREPGGPRFPLGRGSPSTKAYTDSLDLPTSVESHLRDSRLTSSLRESHVIVPSWARGTVTGRPLHSWPEYDPRR